MGKSADPASLGFSALEPADFICYKTPPLPLPGAPSQAVSGVVVPFLVASRRSWAAFGSYQSFFLRRGGFPRALGKRFLRSRNVRARPLGFHVFSGTILGSKMNPWETPGTLKIKVFV